MRSIRNKKWFRALPTKQTLSEKENEKNRVVDFIEEKTMRKYDKKFPLDEREFLLKFHDQNLLILRYG